MTVFQSAQSGFSNRSSLSPGALGAAVAVHIVVAGIVIALPPEFIALERVTELVVRNIPLPMTPVPPEQPSEQKPAKQTHTEKVSSTAEVKPVFVETILPVRGVEIDARLPRVDPPPMPRVEDHILPPPRPVMVSATPDPRFADSFQPTYPVAKLRLGQEGSCTLNVEIDMRGRVARATALSGGDTAFCDAAERQALSKWRFRPATQDGSPVASERAMTVHFRITN